MEKYYRKKIILNAEAVQNLDFQVLSWHTCDTKPNAADENSGSDSDSELNTDADSMLYSIFAFGVNSIGQTVSVKFTGFTPFFYIKVPPHWEQSKLKNIERRVGFKLGSFINDEWVSMKKHLIGCKYVIKKDIYGFNNEKEFKYLRFLFDNEAAMKSAFWMLRKHNDALKSGKDSDKRKILSGFERIKFEIYNANVDSLLTFTTIRKLLMAGWISVSKFKQNDLKHRNSRCEIDIETDWKNVDPIESHTIAPFMTASFDLECYSFDNMFPDPAKDLNVITQIGTSFQKIGTDPETGEAYPMVQHVAVLGECNPLPNGVHMDWYETEAELIIGWIELIEKMDPDQFIGYNIANFDWNYIWVRCQLLRVTEIDRLSRISKIAPSKFKEDKMESSAHLNVFNFIETPGVSQIDFYPWFKSNTKNDFYTLDHISKVYLGEQKRNVTPKQIFEWSGIIPVLLKHGRL